jgi:hypothetical protein
MKRLHILLWIATIAVGAFFLRSLWIGLASVTP